MTSLRDVPTPHSIIFSMFGCSNPSVLSEYASGSGGGGGGGGSGGGGQSSGGGMSGTLGSVVSAKLTNIAVMNVKADHIKKMYEEAVMVRKVRHYLAQMSRLVEKNEERLRLISSTLEHSTNGPGNNGSSGGGGGGGNTLKRNPQSATNHHLHHHHIKPSPNSSLGGSVSSINAALNLSGTTTTGVTSSGNGPLAANKAALFGAHSPDAVKKLLALSETKVKTVKSSSSSSSVPLSQLATTSSSRLPLNTSTSSVLAQPIQQQQQTSTVSPTVPLSPKSKNRAVCSSQPLNGAANTTNTANAKNGGGAESVRLNKAAAADKSKPNTSEKTTTAAAAAPVNGKLLTNGVEADSGRASMASNVDQEQCSPTFQQRAFVLNRCKCTLFTITFTQNGKTVKISQFFCTI